MSDVKYKHFVASPDRDWWGATVAFDDGGRYGVAICSPMDQFSRKKGRTIAKGRMRLMHSNRPHAWPVFSSELVQNEHYEEAWDNVLDEIFEWIEERERGA